jgi:hypothetical protein
MKTKKEILEYVFENKIYKTLAKKLSDEQRELIEKRIEYVADNYSKILLENAAKIVHDETNKKNIQDIFNNQTVINEKTGKPRKEK